MPKLISSNIEWQINACIVDLNFTFWKFLEHSAKLNWFFSYQFVCSTASSRKKKYTKSSNENEATKSGEFNWVESYCWVLRGFLKMIGSTPVKSATVPAYRSSWTSTEVELCQGLNGASPKPEKNWKNFVKSMTFTYFISFAMHYAPENIKMWS